MNRTLYISTNCFEDRSPIGILTTVRQSGWTHVEFSGIRASAKEAILLCRQLRSEEVQVVLHNYFPPPEELFVLNLASRDSDLLGRSRRHCEEAILLSAELGAPFFAAHAGFVVDPPPSLLGDPEGLRRFCRERKGPRSEKEANEIFAESVSFLTDFGMRYDVRFLIENHVVEEGLDIDTARSLLLCLGADDFCQLAKKVGTESFGILLDVGHLRCTSRVLGFSKEGYCSTVSPWIRAFHLSDNDGCRDTHHPFDAQSWFLGIVRSRPHLAGTLEFNRCSPEELFTSIRLLTDS
jgi:sugar phosphate isomerase/epimerase